MIRSVNIDNNKIQDTNSSVKKTSSSQTFTSVLDDVTKTTEASKTTSLDDIFNRASKKYNVSTDLLKAVAKAESNFDPKAVSRSGARGVMQLMPKTAEYLGVKDSFDPEQNIMGGAKYLSQMLEKYDGDIKLSLAAYNAGSGNVAKYGGIPPFKETQNYVVKVMKFMGSNIEVPKTTIKQPSTANTTSKPAVSAADTSTVNNANTVSSSNSANTVNILESLSPDEIYSYEDYLEFIDKWKEQLNLLYLTRNIDAMQNILEKNNHSYSLRAEDDEEEKKQQNYSML